MTGDPGGRGAEGRVVIALARIYAVRYVRHPGYLAGVLLLLASVYRAPTDPSAGALRWDELGISTGLWIGILGVVVGHRLASGETAAGGLLPSLPADATVRTQALVLACLVPAATVVSFMVLCAVVNPVDAAAPPTYPFSLRPDEGTITTSDFVAGQLENVVAGFGGPVLGVVTARWLRLPGAGVLAALALFLVELVLLGIGEGGVSTWRSRWVQGLTNLLPWVYWGAIPGEGTTYLEMRPGAPIGHLLYALALCGLGLSVAVLRSAEPADARVWRRRARLLVAVAAAGYLWATCG